MKSDGLGNISLNVSLSLLIGIFCVFMLSSLGFIFGISINVGYVLTGVTAAVFVPFKLGKFKARESLISLILFVLIVFLSALISKNLMDFSYDGPWYHQTGMLFLKKGWNPIYETAESFFVHHWNTHITGLVWIESYPKFYEIFAANIFYLTNDVETGKMLNFLSGAMLVFYAYYVFDKNLLKEKKKSCLLFSILLACNSVFFAQVFTFYADGLVYVYFMMMILALMDIEQSKSRVLLSQIVLIMSAILLANLKLGGLVYCFFIFVSYGVYKLIYREKLKSLRKMVCLVVFGIVLSGINPYLTNLYQGKHILHPIAGAEKIDVMKHNMPSQFLDKSMPYKLFMSTFSQVDNLYSQYNSSDNKVTLKIPFTVRLSEMQNLKISDTRQCGFGVFWSGILLSALLLAFFIKFRTPKDKRMCFFILGTILLSVLLNPENWWARYVPQFYAFPVFICLFCLISSFAKFRYAATYLVCGMMLFNSILTYKTVYIRAKEDTVYKRTQLKNMELLKRNPNMIRMLEEEEIREDFTAPTLIFLDKYKRK